LRLTHSEYGPAKLYQYYTNVVGLLWAGGDNESGIADYQIAAMASVSADGSVDDGGALMAFTPTHKQNYFQDVRVGAIDTVPFMYYCIQASNRCVFNAQFFHGLTLCRAQSQSKIYIGPIVVDNDPPVSQISTSSDFSIIQTSTLLTISWQSPAFSSPRSTLCVIEWCLGE
jgi:hypothetical protein